MGRRMSWTAVSLNSSLWEKKELPLTQHSVIAEESYEEHSVPAYKRPVWVWFLILAFGVLTAFTAFLWSASRPPHLVSNVGRAVTMDELRTIDEECRSLPWWADPLPECEWVGHAKDSFSESLAMAVLVGLFGMLVANVVAHIPERQIKELIEDVNGLDTGKIVPSYRAKANRRPDATTPGILSRAQARENPTPGSPPRP